MFENHKNIKRMMPKQRIEELTEQSEELNHVRQLAEIKGKFFDVLSHDFRTSLSIILLASGFILRNKDHVNKNVINEKLDLIEKQVTRMSLLLDELVSPESEVENGSV